MSRSTGPAALDARRTVRRRALNLAPWCVALLLVALGFSRLAVPDAPTSADTTAGDHTIGASVAVEEAPDAPDALEDGTDAPASSDVPSLPAELTASVLSAARAALGADGLGTVAATSDATLRWALDLAVARVERAAPGRLVVVVHGTVITSRPGEGWAAPAPAAVAVAVSTSGTPTVGPSWPLAAPTNAVAPNGAVGGSPVTDTDELQQVLDALLDAGWTPDVITSVHALQDSLLLARVDGVAPDGTTGERGVWLVRTADLVHVAGHTPDPSPGHTPDPSPEQDPTIDTTETT